MYNYANFTAKKRPFWSLIFIILIFARLIYMEGGLANFARKEMLRQPGALIVGDWSASWEGTTLRRLKRTPGNDQRDFTRVMMSRFGKPVEVIFTKSDDLILKNADKNSRIEQYRYGWDAFFNITRNNSKKTDHYTLKFKSYKTLELYDVDHDVTIGLTRLSKFTS